MIDKKVAKLGYGVGDVIAIKSGSDWHKAGLRRGTVKKIGRKYVHVADAGRTWRLCPSEIEGKVK